MYRLILSDLHIDCLNIKSLQHDSVKNIIMKKIKQWIIKYNNINDEDKLIDIFFAWDFYNSYDYNNENQYNILKEMFKLIKEILTKEKYKIHTIYYIYWNHELYFQQIPNIEHFFDYKNYPQKKDIETLLSDIFVWTHIFDLNNNFYLNTNEKELYIWSLLYSPCDLEWNPIEINEKLRWITDFKFLKKLFIIFDNLPTITYNGNNQTIINYINIINTKKNNIINNLINIWNNDITQYIFLFHYVNVLIYIENNKNLYEKITFLFHFPFNYLDSSFWYENEILEYNYNKSNRVFNNNLNDYFNVNNKYLYEILEIINNSNIDISIYAWHTHKYENMLIKNNKYENKIHIINNSIWYYWQDY